jgi:hypothetical protein
VQEERRVQNWSDNDFELERACLDGACKCRPGECLVAESVADAHRLRELEAEAKLNGGLSTLGNALAAK